MLADVPDAEAGASSAVDVVGASYTRSSALRWDVVNVLWAAYFKLCAGAAKLHPGGRVVPVGRGSLQVMIGCAASRHKGRTGLLQVLEERGGEQASFPSGYMFVNI